MRYKHLTGHQRCVQLVRLSDITRINSIVIQAKGGIKNIYMILYVQICFLPDASCQHIAQVVIGRGLPCKEAFFFVSVSNYSMWNGVLRKAFL